MKRVLAGAALVALLWQANPKKPPLVQCSCGSWNEPGRTSCRDCKAPL